MHVLAPTAEQVAAGDAEEDAAVSGAWLFPHVASAADASSSSGTHVMTRI